MNDEKKYALNILKTSRGQIEAVIRMLEEDRYCIDVSNQINAVQGLLKKANLTILKQHMNHCVKDAFIEGNGDEKIEEIMSILDSFGAK
jgi:DNA-binding FrmR family transcriptional regulator